MAKLVSKTYGEALFAAVMEEQTSPEAGLAKADELMQEIQVLRSILRDNQDFDKLMKHPGIPKQEKIKVMEDVFRGRISDELMGFFGIVLNKERYRELDSIFQYFTDKVKEANRIGVAYVTTAVKLDDAQRARVQEKLLATTSYRRMEMNYSVDTSLIGGMVIRINDRVVDSSVRSKLNDLTKQLLQIQLG